MKLSTIFGWFLLPALASFAFAQIQLGETQLRAGGNYNVGYSGNYGDAIQSSHGLDLGFSNDVNGSYYNPNFLNFDTVVYYNQSRADSDYQSLTNASGVSATANFFGGSRTPGSLSYHYDYNSTGTFGLPGTPNFTTKGNGQGFAVNWSVLQPGLPTLSVGYQHGSGDSTLYGTEQNASSDQNLFNLHSSYQMYGFRMNGYYDHTSLDSDFPQFLSGTEDKTQSSGQDFGFNTNRNLPWWHGSFYTGYNHSSYSSNFTDGEVSTAMDSGYTADMENSGASFHPMARLTLSVNQNYTSNLSAYLNQSLVTSGPNVNPVVDLGSGSYSNTVSGSAGYQFTNTLAGSAQATHYQQSYLGHSYDGTFVSGYVTYGKKLFDMFSFSAGVVDSSINFNGNELGFVGTVNYFHRFGAWETSGVFAYAQNVQSALVTETTSYYNYNANIHRRFSSRVQWTGAFNGSHSGLSDTKNGASSSEGFSTTLSLRKIQFSGLYNTGSGNSVYTATGMVGVPTLPGETLSDVIAYNAKSYGGSVSLNPIQRLIITGNYSRALSDTVSYGVPSRNNTEIIYTQLQYRLRRISVLAGYTRFSQGFTALGPTAAPTTSYYAGISRWFNFF